MLRVRSVLRRSAPEPAGDKLADGELIADTTVRDFIDRSSQNHVRVRSPRAGLLMTLLTEHGALVTTDVAGALEVTGMECKAIGELASMPAKEVIFAKLLYVINAPAQQLVTVMNAVGRNLAVVVDQGVKENKFSA